MRQNNEEASDNYEKVQSNDIENPKEGVTNDTPAENHIEFMYSIPNNHIENKQIHEHKKRKGYIGTYEQYPEDLRDNEYLLTGYRCDFDTWPSIWRSLFMCHNETVNVWTHLLGCIGFIIATFVVIFGFRYMNADGKFMVK